MHICGLLSDTHIQRNLHVYDNGRAPAQKFVSCFLGLSLVDREPFAWVHRFEHAIQANTLFRRCICFHIEQKVLSTVSMNTIVNYGWVPYLADEWFRSFQTLIPISNFGICGRNTVVLPFKQNLFSSTFVPYAICYLWFWKKYLVNFRLAAYSNKRVKFNVANANIKRNPLPPLRLCHVIAQQ